MKNQEDIKIIIRKLEGWLEVAALVAVYYFILISFYKDLISTEEFIGSKYILIGVYALLLVILFVYCDGFKFGFLKATDIMISQWIALGIVNVLAYFQLCLTANTMVRLWPVLICIGASFLIALLCTYAYTFIYHRVFAPMNMAIIYENENAFILKFKMNSEAKKYNIKEMLHVNLGYDEICREIIKYDAVVISEVPVKFRDDIMKFCYEKNIRMYIAPKISDIFSGAAEHITLFDSPLLLVRGCGLNVYQRFIKRGFDIVVCLIGLVPLVLLIFIVAVAIKLEDGGPVFFVQKRVTINGKVFNIIKFRSMITDAEKDGKSTPAVDNDPRITKVGRFLRRSRIDELPQFINILKGDMSLVGPRPERVEHVEKYTREIPEFSYRTKVKGGLTGYAQIFGKYNTSAYDKLRLDLMYIENYSIMLDIKLLLMTIRVMFKKEATEGFNK